MPKPVDQQAPKAENKPAITTDSSPPKKPEPKAEKPKEAKAEPKADEPEHQPRSQRAS